MKKPSSNGESVSPPNITAAATSENTPKRITDNIQPASPVTTRGRSGFVKMSHRIIPEKSPPRTAVGVTPDVASLNGSGYKDLAASLPSPSYLLDDVNLSEEPQIADAYTIPGGHVDAESLPFNRKGLPWRSWRSKYATIESLYVLAARHYANAGERRAVHAVFSPSPDTIENESDVETLKQQTISVAENHGIRGGVTAFHGFRVNSRVSERFSELIAGSELAETATGVLLWEWVRQANGVDVSEFLTWGPHVHIIGLCREEDDEIDSYRGEGVFRELREFAPYSRDMPMEAIADHRSVGKDTIDHLTFRHDGSDAPMQWFGSLEGDSPMVAEQYATDYTIDELRERLINGPTNPEFYDVGVTMNVRTDALINQSLSIAESRISNPDRIKTHRVIGAVSDATISELTRDVHNTDSKQSTQGSMEESRNSNPLPNGTVKASEQRVNAD